jgi:hypothetical protein
LAVINSRLADVKFTPMRTNSCKEAHFCATVASPRSPIRFAFHPSTCSLRRRGAEDQGRVADDVGAAVALER